MPGSPYGFTVDGLRLPPLPRRPPPRRAQCPQLPTTRYDPVKDHLVVAPSRSSYRDDRSGNREDVSQHQRYGAKAPPSKGSARDGATPRGSVTGGPILSPVLSHTPKTYSHSHLLSENGLSEVPTPNRSRGPMSVSYAPHRHHRDAQYQGSGGWSSSERRISRQTQTSVHGSSPSSGPPHPQTFSSVLREESQPLHPLQDRRPTTSRTTGRPAYPQARPAADPPQAYPRSMYRATEREPDVSLRLGHTHTSPEAAEACAARRERSRQETEEWRRSRSRSGLQSQRGDDSLYLPGGPGGPSRVRRTSPPRGGQTSYPPQLSDYSLPTNKSSLLLPEEPPCPTPAPHAPPTHLEWRLGRETPAYVETQYPHRERSVLSGSPSRNLVERVRLHSNDRPEEEVLLEGFELLPSQPRVQGMRETCHDRYARTVQRFVRAQPPSEREELARLLAEYTGREKELCVILSRIFGDEFDEYREMS